MIRPTGDHVVIKRDDLTAPPDVYLRKGSKLIIPQNALARAREGKVLFIGPKVREDIRVGDRVAITWHEGTRYHDKHLGEIELFLETEVLAVLGR